MGIDTSKLTVGSFPYRPGFNPYQRLFTQALESAGLKVRRIPPTKWFPLSHACGHPVDVLHLDWHHDWYRGINGFTQLMKRLMYQHGLRACSRLPVVWTAHNLESHDTADVHLDHTMTQRLIDVCRGIIVMSDASEALLRSKYHVSDTTAVQKVYHGHYIDCYKNEIKRSTARERLEIGEEEFVYLTLGSIRPYKGHVELIRAFRSIATNSERLVIAGSATDGAYLTQLQKLIAEQHNGQGKGKIDLHAHQIPDDDLQLYFNAADVCVLPFQNILNSGSLLLAMSFGKPVVAAAIGSIPEVAHPESYVGYDPSTPEGLRDALGTARQKSKKTSPQEGIVDFTRKKYDWHSVGIQLQDYYLELLGR